jgi:hypothetical protein
MTTLAKFLSSPMQDKRIIILVSLALLVVSTVADAKFRKRWSPWGIDECNGDRACAEEKIKHRSELALAGRYCYNQDLAEYIFYVPFGWWEEDICEFIPDSHRISECAL